MAGTSGRSDPVCLFGILMVVIFIGILNYRKRKEDAYKTAKYQNDGTLESDAGHGDHL